MKDKIKVFIEKEAFERFILNEQSFNNLLTIFSEHSLICLNMTDADIDKEWQTVSLDGQRGGSKIRKFCTGHSMRRPQSAHSDFEKPFGKGFFNVSSELSLDLDRVEQGIFDEGQD